MWVPCWASWTLPPPPSHCPGPEPEALHVWGLSLPLTGTISPAQADTAVCLLNGSEQWTGPGSQLQGPCSCQQPVLSIRGCAWRTPSDAHSSTEFILGRNCHYPVKHANFGERRKVYRFGGNSAFQGPSRYQLKTPNAKNKSNFQNFFELLRINKNCFNL